MIHFLFLFLILINAVCGTTVATANLTTLLPIPPRYMWGWGGPSNGFCGECSFQSAALYYGSYVSQELIREAATTPKGELLIGVNDVQAADKLKLTHAEWDFKHQPMPQNHDFLLWTRDYVQQGVPVVAGWYATFGTDPDYDHIMPIIGVQTDSSTNAVNALLYNDLYLNYTVTDDKRLDRSRVECEGTYSRFKVPGKFCIPHEVDYAIAILGNVDVKNETVRMSLSVSRWDEPDWSKEDGKYEPAVVLEANVTFPSTLTVGKRYSILRFDSPKDVPSEAFLQGPWTWSFNFTASAAHMTVPVDGFLSNGSFFFRTVLSP